MEFLNAFTVDVEDYFQVSAFERHVRREDWGRWECRVVANTRRVLELLDRRRVRATFFVLGWVAEHYPELLREVLGAGHEIGSHGYWHRLVYDQRPEEFRADLRRSRKAIEDAIGGPVRAHRAASFSVTRRSLWAFEVLAEEGFAIDSSVFPIRHDRYGMADAPLGIHPVATPHGTVREFPMSVATFGRLRFPAGGGGYFRLYPLRLSLGLLRRINLRHRRPFVFYVHPWEVDPEQPRIAGASRLSRFRHYVNLATTERKLDVLLQRFRFGRLSDAVEQAT